MTDKTEREDGPPASEEVEVFCVPPGYYSGPDGGIAAGEMVFAQDYRAHATRLQTERDAIELNLKRMDNAFASLTAERDALKAEVERMTNLHAAMQLQRNHHRDKSETLQSELTKLADDYCKRTDELTKALELLSKLRHGSGMTLKDCAEVNAQTDSLLAHQSAPAVKVCECGPLRHITDGGHFPACTRCHKRISP